MQQIFRGTQFVMRSELMETKPGDKENIHHATGDKASRYEQERAYIADQLQNEVNQTLTSVLLLLQFSKKENGLENDMAIHQAEINLKEAINRLRSLHYSLSGDL